MGVNTPILARMPGLRNSHSLLKECALFDLQRASRVVSSLYNERLRGCGITIAQFSLMRSIEALQPVGMARLARAMAMDRTSVTRVIEPLLERGLVTASVGDDRRVRNLELTAKGSAAMRRAKMHWARAQRQLLGALGNRQWLSLRKALRTTIRLARDLPRA